jgi:sec-independent protein translocase protein TatC
VTRIAWRLIERVSRLLEPNEREAVLGDFAETGESAARALLDLAGLLIRRRSALWGKPLLCSLGGIAVGAAVCFVLMDHIYGYLARPLTDSLVATGLSYATPVNPFDLYVKLSVVCGVFLASPYVLRQLWLLFSPHLSPVDNGYAWPFVLLTSALFATGGFVGYEWALPTALRVLLNFASRSRAMVTINEFWNLAIAVVVGTALVVESLSLCGFMYMRQKRAKGCSQT